MKNKWLAFLLITSFVIGAVLRLSYLNVLPVSLSHDEIDNIIQAHSVIHSGSDIEGSWRPWDFLPNGGMMSELGPLINVPTLALLPQSLATSRLMTVIYSMAIPLVVMFWLKLLGSPPAVSVVAAILLYISPWHVIFSRTALEQPTSLFWYLSSWVILVSSYPKKFSLLRFAGFCFTFALGFYTYHGFKFTMPLLTLLQLLWLAWGNRINFRQARFLLPLIFILFLLARVLYNSSAYRSRGSELLISNVDTFSGEVNHARTLALAPTYLESIFINKYSRLASTLRDNYFAAFSPGLLFIRGEASGAFSVGSGYLYPFTLPLLAFGIFSLFRRNPRTKMLILALLLVSPLSTVIHVNGSFAFRSAIYFVLLNSILAYGIVELYKWLVKKHNGWSIIYTCVLPILFAVSIMGFAFRYFALTPSINAQAFFFDERLIAEYVRRNPAKKILIIDHQPRYIYSNIVLSRSRVGALDMAGFNRGYSPIEENVYESENLLVTGRCPKLGSYDVAIVRSDSEEYLTNCPAVTALQGGGHVTHAIVSTVDSGLIRYLVGDTFCDTSLVRPYINPTSLADFNLDHLSDVAFCYNYIVAK